MLNWKEYSGHEPDIRGKRRKFDNTIYTFDIETSSYLILNGTVIPACEYETLTKKEQELAIKQSNMYIWMFGINDTVYYGRTWEEFKLFLNKLYEIVPETKYIFIHNLSFEFQYLKSILNIDSVFARAVHKPMKATCKDYNIEFRCSYMMSNCSLAKLPKLFNLPIEKKVGDLDYNLIRNSKSILTSKELGYCEYDCLVVYEYIKYELRTYEEVKTIPFTSTGHVRRELKNLTKSNYVYKKKVKRSVNTEGHIYNLLLQAFAGGYTHANFRYTDEIIENIDSWDFTSSYPYCICVNQFPMSKFTRCNVKRVEDMYHIFAYLLVVRFTNLRSKYWNNFISKNKCRNSRNYKEDNGRLISADQIEMTLTDIDFKMILESYDCEYEILESYSAAYDYLPKEVINFTLDKYVFKTKYKGDPNFELEYSTQKALFNSIYGMMCTNSIRSDVDCHDGEWIEIPLTNQDILDKLLTEEKSGFLSFAWGVWVTAYARYNLISNIMKLDDYVVYCDTDSIKVTKGYDEEVINEYNTSVLNKLSKVSRDLNIPYEKFSPKDKDGNEHPLGVFDDDGHYLRFITQGAKKYCYECIKKKDKFKNQEKINEYREKNKQFIIEETDEYFKELHITVSGVPKSGVKSLNGHIEHFRDDLVFEHKFTNKNLLMYCEEQLVFNLVDYNGVSDTVVDTSGCCILPTTYILGKSEDYTHLLSEDSSKRAIYKEG